MAPRFIAKQLSRPTGVIGIIIRHLMNRHNARMNAFAVGQLQLAPSDRVLEIGFGGGSTLAALLNTAAFVAGVDRSRDVISWAKRHFAKAIESGRAEFRQGNVESLPFNEAAFDKVCTVNTVYFWTSLAVELLLASCPRRKWTAWACPAIFSRRARPAMSRSQCGERASTTSGSSVQHLRLPGTFSSRRADHTRRPDLPRPPAPRIFPPSPGTYSL